VNKLQSIPASLLNEHFLRWCGHILRKAANKLVKNSFRQRKPGQRMWEMTVWPKN